MHINRNTGLAVALMAMTALGLSACGSAGDGKGGQSGSLNGDGRIQTTGTPVTGRNTLDDGVLHVWPQEVADRVFFDTDKYSVRPEGRELLLKWVAFLQTHPRDQLLIEGHADEHGTREYNLALGDRRAAAIKEFLVASGVQGERIKTISYGKERPAVLGSNDSAYSQNRRAVGVLQ
jgi:peptidoglycan-associated lipoprotein